MSAEPTPTHDLASDAAAELALRAVTDQDKALVNVLLGLSGLFESQAALPATGRNPMGLLPVWTRTLAELILADTDPTPED